MASIPVIFEARLEGTKRVAQEVRDTLNQIRSVNRAFNQILSTQKTPLARQIELARVGLTDMKSAAEKAAESMNDLGAKARLTAQRFIVYNIIASFFFRLTDAIRGGINAFVDFDATLNKAQQILNPLTSDIKALQESIFALGNEFGVTIKQVQDAQETFLRQGVTQKKALELTRASLGLATAGAYDFAESTEAITSALAQFNIDASQATKITDKLVAVSINYAAEVGDLDQGLRRAGFAAQAAGTNFDELVGFITAAQEATRRGGEVIGTALRTIFTRLFRAPSVELLKSLGIEVRTASGEFRSATQILGDLAGKFQDLDDTQRLSIASTIAGQRQISTLLAILERYDRAALATKTSVNALGVTEELTRKRQESLQAQLTKITNQFVSFGVAVGQAISPSIIELFRTFSSIFEFLGGAVQKASGSTFETLINTLTKLATLWALQELGVGKFNVALTRLDKTWKDNNKNASQYEKNVRKIEQIIEKQKAGGFFNKTSGSIKFQESERKLREESARVASAEAEIQKVILEATKLTADWENEKIIQKQLGIEYSKEQAVTEKNISLIQKEQVGFLTKSNILINRIANTRVSDYRLQAEDQLLAKLNEELVILQKIGTTGTSTAAERLAIGKKIVALNKEIRAIDENIKETASKKRFGGQKEELARLEEEKQGKVGERRRQIAALREVAGKTEIDQASKMLRIQLRIAAIEEGREKRLRKISGFEKELSDLQLQTDRKIQEIENSTLDSEQKRIALNKQLEESLARQTALVQAIRDVKAKLPGSQQKLNDLLKRQNELMKENQEAAKAAGQAFLGRKSKIGIAFAASLGFDAIAQGFDSIAEKGDKTFAALATGAREVGGIISTAMIAGTGPIGLILIGMQAITAVMRLIRQAGEESIKVLEKATKESEFLNQSIRAVESSFNTFLQTLSKADISLEDLSAMEQEFTDLETGLKLASGSLNLFKSQLFDAVTRGDIERVKELRSEVQKFISLEKIKSGELINNQLIEDSIELIERTSAKIGEMREEQSKLRAQAKESRPSFLGGPDFEKQIANLDEKIKEIAKDADPARQSLAKLGAELLTIFPQVIDPTKSVAENLEAIRPGLSELAQRAGITAAAFNQLALAQGAVLSNSLEDITASQTEEEKLLSAQLTERVDKAKGDIRALIPAMAALSKEQQRSIEVGIRFNREVFRTDKSKAFIHELAQLGKVTDEQMKTKLVEGFKKGRDGIIATQLATGDFAITIAATGQKIVVTDEQFQSLAIAAKGLGGVLTVNTETVKELSKAQLASNIITEAYIEHLKILNTQIKDSSKLTGEYQNSISKLVSVNEELSQSMPARMWNESINGLDTITKRANAAAQASEGMLTVMRLVQATNEDLAIIIDNKLTQSLADGGDAADLYAIRIEAIRNKQIALNSTAQDLNATLYSISLAQRGGNLGFDSEQLSETAAAILNAQKLRLALAALAAERDRILASKKPLFEQDRENLKKLTADVSKQLGIEERPDLLPTDLSDVSAKEAAGRIDKWIKKVGEKSLREENPTFRKLNSDMIQRIVDVTEPTTTETGDVLFKPMTEALLTATDTMTEAMDGAMQEMRGSLEEMQKTAQASFEFVLSTATKQLDSMAKLIQGRKFLPDFNKKDVKENILSLFSSVRAAAEGQLKDVTQQLKDVNLTIEGLRSANEALKNENGQVLDENMQEFAANLERVNNLQAIKNKLLIDEQTALASRNLDVAKFIGFAEAAVSAVKASQKELFAAQNELVNNEITGIRKRLEFNQEEANTTERKIALARLEGNLVEETIRNVEGIGNISADDLADEISRLNERIIRATVDGLNTAQQEQLQLELQGKQNQLDGIKQIADARQEQLTKELSLINEQINAVRGLGNEFLKANNQQQAQMVESARLVDKFFGDLRPASLETPVIDDAINKFLKTATDEQRVAVIGQLERLRGVGEVAPGVSAGDLLNKIEETVGGALFVDPQVNLLEDQKKIQSDMLTAILNSTKLEELQVKIANSQIVASNNVAKAIVSLGKDPRASQEVNQTARELEQGPLAASMQELNDIQASRIALEQRSVEQAESAKISNKNFIETTRQVDLATTDAAKSNEELQEKLIGLRDALITAEDKFADAQVGLQDALAGVAAAVGDAAAAQAEYILGIKEADRANLSAVGGFITFRDELSFLNEAYNQQIRTLETVGAKESQVAELRVKLAQEQLAIFEQQIAAFKDQALSLFTGDLQPANVVRQAQAAETVGGIVAGGTSLTDIFNQLAALPEDFRRQALEGLNLAKAIPGQTIAGLSPDEIINQIAAAFGGQAPGGGVLTLEEEAAAQRKIIAENSIGQLESSRQSVIAAYQQLAAAQEALMEAKAQKELAQMQLDATSQGFMDVTSIMSVVADSINNHLGPGSALWSSFSNLSVGNVGNFARGSLSVSEVNGLLSAGLREKRAMPSGSRLGVFNTSETVLTRNQMGKLRSGFIPNAANGFGTAGGDTNRIIEALGEIARRIDSMNADNSVKTINLEVGSRRTVDVQGVAGIQTALQDIISARTGELFSKEEGRAIEMFIEGLVNKLRTQGLQIDTNMTRGR